MENQFKEKMRKSYFEALFKDEHNKEFNIGWSNPARLSPLSGQRCSLPLYIYIKM
jgi:hypothetical protein